MTGAVDVQILNHLLEHRNFPKLIDSIRIYFQDTAAKGIMARNQLIEMATASLSDLMKEQPGEAVTAAMFQTMRNALAEQKQNSLSVDDVTAMIAGQIGQLAPMDKETADLFKQLAKKMMTLSSNIT